MVPARRSMFCPYLKGTGLDAQGDHAEYMLMNADATYLIPDKVSYEHVDGAGRWV
jgi:alcohol dehydrogenase